MLLLSIPMAADARQREVEAALRALSRARGGAFRTSEALARGVHPRDLYRLRDDGALERVSRGVYRFAGRPALAYPDLVTVALRVPRAVVCLVSALHLHGLTGEIPREVSIALPAGTKAPALAWPPLRVYRFSGELFELGVERRVLDGVPVRVYGAARSVIDAFRFRRRLGLEVALEALRAGLARRAFTPAELLALARRCRAAGVIRPYLESLA